MCFVCCTVWNLLIVLHYTATADASVICVHVTASVDWTAVRRWSADDAAAIGCSAAAATATTTIWQLFCRRCTGTVCQRLPGCCCYDVSRKADGFNKGSTFRNWLPVGHSCFGVCEDNFQFLRSTLSLTHYLRWRMPPFMRQCWGLPHRLAQCTRSQGWGKLVNAALLSLITEACVNVCCATLLSSELVGPACVQARSSNPRGRACRPRGKRSGEKGILSGIVPVYLYCPAFSVSVSLGV